MKELSVWAVAVLMIAAGLRFAWQIRKGTIKPPLSTWIIFLAATGLSLTTYAIAEKHDFRSGVLNLMDVVATGIVLSAILLWGKRETHFKPFEKWYLGGVGVIIAYGFLSGDAWSSNLFTQVLISVGYLPTLQNLMQEKKNSESFTGWGLGFAAGVVALYPAFVDGNVLAAVYAVRTIVLIGLVLLLMTYYQFRK